jgi:hypothetical protein
LRQNLVQFICNLVNGIVAKSKGPGFDDKDDVENGRRENPDDDEDSDAENLDRLAAVLAGGNEDSDYCDEKEQGGEDQRDQSANCRRLKKKIFF